ncbi:MAG: hypothetical protein M1818_000609 [Claussenomyces sp. TS43310]|nr:MAG: hypothetical protein M1818_000609 [Claussenomyces sp. TS43310]
MSGAIPILDYSLLHDDPAKFVQELKDVASRWGFFFLKNHPIPKTEVDQNFALAKHFFAEPSPGDEYKINESNVGYSGRWCEGYGRDDHISFNFGGRYGMPMNLPPTLSPHYQRIQEFKRSVQDLALELMRGFAIALDLEADHFAKWHDITKDPVRIPWDFHSKSERSSRLRTLQGMNLRFMYYPENHAPEHGQTRIREHSDFGTITVLFQHDVGGLEVLSPSGQWVTAPVIEGAPLINIGDFLQIWSGGALKSTVHRLTFKNGCKERYSMPCFVGANADAVLAPIKEGHVKMSCPIDGMTAGEYNNRRLKFLHHGGDPSETPFITREDQPYHPESVGLSPVVMA